MCHFLSIKNLLYTKKVQHANSDNKVKGITFSTNGNLTMAKGSVSYMAVMELRPDEVEFDPKNPVPKSAT